MYRFERAVSPHENISRFSAMGYTHRRGYAAPSGLAEYQALKGRHLLTKGVALRENEDRSKALKGRHLFTEDTLLFCDGLHPSQGVLRPFGASRTPSPERATSTIKGLRVGKLSAMGYTHRREVLPPSGLAEHQALKGRHQLTKGEALREHEERSKALKGQNQLSTGCCLEDLRWATPISGRYFAPSGLAEHQALKGRHLLTKGAALREHQDEHQA